MMSMRCWTHGRHSVKDACCHTDFPYILVDSLSSLNNQSYQGAIMAAGTEVSGDLRDSLRWIRAG